MNVFGEDFLLKKGGKIQPSNKAKEKLKEVNFYQSHVDSLDGKAQYPHVE